MELRKEVKALIEMKYGAPVTYPSDCYGLMLDIEKRTHQHIGLNTLKRLYGFFDTNVEPRQNTLDIIAAYLGFSRWDKLLMTISDAGNSGFDEFDEDIVSISLQEDVKVKIEYAPDRIVVFKHIEDELFCVEQSVNSKLLVGDRVWISKFILNCPLYASNVERAGVSLGKFTAGKEYGLNKVELVE